MFLNVCSLLLKIYRGVHFHLQTIMCSLVILQVVQFPKRGSLSLCSITLIFAVVPFENIFKLCIYVALSLSPSVQVLSQVYVICQLSYKCTIFSAFKRGVVPLMPRLQCASCIIPDGNSNHCSFLFLNFNVWIN